MALTVCAMLAGCDALLSQPRGRTGAVGLPSPDVGPDAATLADTVADSTAATSDGGPGTGDGGAPDSDAAADSGPVDAALTDSSAADGAVGGDATAGPDAIAADTTTGADTAAPLVLPAGSCGGGTVHATCSATFGCVLACPTCDPDPCSPSDAACPDACLAQATDAACTDYEAFLTEIADQCADKLGTTGEQTCVKQLLHYGVCLEPIFGPPTGGQP